MCVLCTIEDRRARMSLQLGSLLETSHGGHQALRSMEGLRGLAVFLVFLVHYLTLVEPWIEDLEVMSARAATIRDLGNVGVDLFFVLSGYLIYGSLVTKRQAFWPYLRRRIERLYPTFTLVFVLYLGLSFAFPENSKLPPDLWDSVRYVCENYLLLPGIFAIKPMISVAWSLSYEMLFYLAVPTFIVLLGLRQWSRMPRVILLVGLATLVWLYPALFGGHVRLIMFVAGMLLFELVRIGAGKYRDALGLVGLAFTLGHVSVFAALGIYGPLRYLILGIAFVLLCLACFSADGVCRRIFSWTPMRWLGNISYSFYLIHGLALNFFFLLLHDLVPPEGDAAAVFWLSFPLGFAVAFLVSASLFFVVERPCSLTPSSVPRNFFGYPRR